MGTGLGREYYDNSQLKSEVLFLEGEFHGVWKEWDEKGNLQVDGTRYWIKGRKVNREEFMSTLNTDIFLSKFYEAKEIP